MAQNLLQKILFAHLVSGKPIPGEDIGLIIAQTFANDATGSLTLLQFEAIGIPRVQVDPAVLYADRSAMFIRPEDADEQRFLAAIAAHIGVAVSRAGNGAGPQVHLERFAVPGKTLLAADSYAAICGSVGMLAIGASSLEVAVAMAGAPFYMPTPRALGIRLTGRLQPWVTAKDVGLEVVRRLGIRGGIGRVLEFTGDGVATLAVPDRAAIAAMAVETGAVSVLFPSDEQTRRFLEAQGRVRQFTELLPDAACNYDEDLAIDLEALEPLVARPGSPADVVTVRKAVDDSGSVSRSAETGTEAGPTQGTTGSAGTVAVHQVIVGSFAEPGVGALRAVAALTESRGVSPEVSAVIVPGSRQLLLALAQSGDLARLIAAGWRILEPGCGPDLGLGQVPPDGSVSLRTFTRNTPGRSGRDCDAVYLSGPLVAAASAITGVLTDPRTLGADPPRSDAAETLPSNDRLITFPGTTTAAGPGTTTAASPGTTGETTPEPDTGADLPAPLRRLPHLQPMPTRDPLGARLHGSVVLKVGDRFGADDILPPSPEAMVLRTDPAALADLLFSTGQPASGGPAFAARCRSAGGGILVAGADFGHGPGREAMAMALGALELGAVVAKDFARINRAHLISFGILPLLLVDPTDHDRLDEGDVLEIPDLGAVLRSEEPFALRNLTKKTEVAVRHGLTQRQKEVLAAGGMLAWARHHSLSPSVV